MNTIIETRNNRVNINNDVITIRPKRSFSIVLAAIIMASGAAFYAISIGLVAMTGDASHEMIPFLRWAAYLISGFGVLLLLEVLFISPRQVIIDPNRGILKVKRKQYPLGTIEKVTLAETTLSNIPLFNIYAHIGGKPVRLMNESGEQHEDQMKQVCDAINNVIAGAAGTSIEANTDVPIEDDLSLAWRFYVLLFFVLVDCWLYCYPRLYFYKNNWRSRPLDLAFWFVGDGLGSGDAGAMEIRDRTSKDKSMGHGCCHCFLSHNMLALMIL